MPSAAGAAGTIQPLRAGPLPAPVFAKPFKDRVLRHAPTRAAAASVAARPEQPYATPDGYTVLVAVSASYPDNAQTQAVVQNNVNFLATRTHGTELGQLHVLVARPAEIHAQCGAAEAVACYFPGERRMYIPGEPDPNAPNIPVEYVMTHEYGHHIATFRQNALDDALDGAFTSGPEYWATYEHICAGVEAGHYFPGDQGEHYLDNPGEGWADSYAHLPEHYPNFLFQFDPSFTRDQGAFDAIHRDIADPWQGNVRQTFSGQLGARRHNQSFHQTVTLDGPLLVRLTARRGAQFAIRLAINGRTVDRSKNTSNHVGISGRLCAPPGSPPSVDVGFKVLRRRGSSPFTLTAQYAG
ncbi:MAG TPA: hypothetical protein VHE14_04135 [Solirubrobacteraceae bacterium]|nr:hypothetical protein [Solirubrobacteraceae bacterium]